MAAEAARLVQIRDFLIESIAETFGNAYLIGDRYRRLPGHICLGFAGQEGEAIKLLLELDEQGIAVSSGSACSSHHAGQPSHVLQAMGFDPTRARGSLRITLGRFNTREEAERFLEVLPAAVRKTAFDAPAITAAMDSLRIRERYQHNYSTRNTIMVDAVNIELPELDCGLCGYRTCDELRERLTTSPEMIRRCIHLSETSASNPEAICRRIRHLRPSRADSPACQQRR